MQTTKISPIGMGTLPGRQNPQLWEIVDGEVRILATFKSAYALERFLSYDPRVNSRKLVGSSGGPAADDGEIETAADGDE